MSAANKIDYVEFHAVDLAATRQFFEALFGWKFENYGPDYTSFADGRINGGFARGEKRASVANGSALIVFYHPELEKVRDKVVALGGKITQEIFSFPGGRRFHFTEPSGNEMAVWGE
jgi:uncharacterized protein